MGKWKALVKASPIWPLVRPRRFHAYGVGAAKTGTVALAAMLRPKFRSAHEPAFHKTIDLVMDAASGRIEGEELRHDLRERDRRLWLEIESSHLMAIFCRELADEFPEAKFILTVRDCRSWLDSIINQHLNVDVSMRPRERAFREFLYGKPAEPHDENDECLLSRGLFSVAGYLTAWSRHNQVVMGAIPEDRLLVLRTQHLSQSLPTIVAFIGISNILAHHGSPQYHVAPRRHGIVAILNQKKLDERIEEICTEAIRCVNRGLSPEDQLDVVQR